MPALRYAGSRKYRIYRIYRKYHQGYGYPGLDRSQRVRWPDLDPSQRVRWRGDGFYWV
jgi:hypothetical protein